MGSITAASLKLLNSSQDDPTTLDWYEEGTWTPALSCTTPGTMTMTYIQQAGSFTRIGRLCHLNGFISLSAFTIGTATGDVFITGAPFTPAPAPHNYYGVCYPIRMSIGGNQGLICGLAPPNRTMYFRAPVSGASAYTPLISGIQATTTLLFSITYNVE